MTCISPTLQAFKIYRLLLIIVLHDLRKFCLIGDTNQRWFLPYDCERVAPSWSNDGADKLVLCPFLYYNYAYMIGGGRQKEKEIREIIHLESVVSMPCVPQCVLIICVHVSVCTNVHQSVCVC